MRLPHRILLALTVCALTLAAPFALPTAHAQTITLTDPNCTRDGLNDAIQNAPDGSTITFNCANPTIIFANEITINKNITIDGGGVITLDGGMGSRLFDVGVAVSVTLQGLTLQNGSGLVAGAVSIGTTATVNIIDSTLTSNASTGDGGAIYNNGILFIQKSIFSNNAAGTNGGAIYNNGGTITIQNSTLSGNTAQNGGGAVYQFNGALTVSTNSSIVQNTALERGGGVYIIDGNFDLINSSITQNLARGGVDGIGGGLYNSGTTTVTNSSISNNDANGSAGFYNEDGITIENSSIDGNTASGNFGGFYNNGSTVIVNGGTISGNSAANFGGGFVHDTAAGAGALSITGTTIAGNTVGANGGGFILQGANPVNVTLSNVTITQNNSGRNGGGFVHAAANANLEIVDSRIESNQATESGGGFVNYDNLTITNTFVVGNTAATGGGFANSDDGNLTLEGAEINGNTSGGYNDSTGSVQTRGACFIGNGIGFEHAAATTITIAGVWWGSPTGPSGIGPGTGDALLNTGGGNVIFEPWQTEKLPSDPCLPVDAFPASDFYTVSAGDTLNVDAANGVLSNDIDYVPGTVALETNSAPDSAASFNLNPDGSFTYQSNANPPFNLDAFRYTVRDSRNELVTGLVCISLTDLALQVPPDQTTQLGQPIPIPGVVISNRQDPNSNDFVQVRITANTGILRVDPNLVNQGTVTILTPRQECQQVINELLTASTKNSTSVVRSQSAQYQRMAFQTVNVTAEGNGTSQLELEGPLQDVNFVLTTLTYEPTQVGVDTIRVIANDSKGGITFDSFRITVNGSEDGGDDGDGGDGGGNDSGVDMLQIPLGPLTLFEISQFPNTVIRGESQTITVDNGDVFVQVYATNGTLRVGTEQIGDPFLLEQGVFNGAEVFGLTFGGVPVSGFNTNITVCLRGFGTFYYRDATDMPRRTIALQSFIDGEFTCAIIPNSGTVVLVAGTLDDANVREAQNAAVFVPESSALPDGCMVTTNAIINLREGPGTGNAIIRRIPFDVTLTAFEQSGGWYYVDYWGLQGWMSADFVTPNTRCE